MPPKLGLSTSYFAARGFSIYDSVAQAYKLGFRLIELGANHDFEENIAQTLRKIHQDFPDVTFTQHCYFPPILGNFFANPAEGLTPKNKKVLRFMFETAKFLGTKILSFHAGLNNKFIYKGKYRQFAGFKEFTATKKIPQTQALRGLKSFTQFVLENARVLGTKVAIENIVGGPKASTTLTSLADFKTFLEEFPDLYFLFDFGHAAIVFSDPDEFFTLKERIVEMHLDDVTPAKLDHRALGNGILDLDRLFSQIKKLPRLPVLVLEHSAEVKEEEIYKEVKLVEKYLGEW